MAAAQYHLEQAADGPVLRLVGDWTVSGLPDAERRSQGTAADASTRPVRVDARELAALDTAGALMLIQRWLGRMPWPAIEGLRPADQDLLALVGERMATPRVRKRLGFPKSRVLGRKVTSYP